MSSSHASPVATWEEDDDGEEQEQQQRDQRYDLDQATKHEET